MNLLNIALRRLGFVVVPTTSGKLLQEFANVVEVHHPARGGHGVVWLRTVAHSMPYHK